MGSLCKPQVVDTQQRVALPQYLQDYEQQAVNRLLEASDIGRAISGFSIDPNTGELVTPEYTRYGGDRVQPFVSDQLTGFDAVRDIAGFGGQPARGSQALQSGYGLVNSATQSWGDTGGANFAADPVSASTLTAGRFTDPGVASEYMNPYMDEVAQAVLRDLDRRESTRGIQEDAQLANQGALGNTRAGVVAGDRAREFDTTRADTLAQLYGTAYDKAGALFGEDAGRALEAGKANQLTGLNAQQFNNTFGLDAFNSNRDQFNTDQDRALQGAPLLADMGSLEQQMALTNANALLGVGATQQLQGQTGLDTAYSDFMNQQAFPYQQYGFLQSTFTGQPAQTAPYTQYGQQAGPSLFQQAAGAAAAGIGAYGAFKPCWVAREVYGEDNPRWVQFRDWLLNRAPAALREFYLENGEAIAAELRTEPEARARVRALMDGILAGEEDSHALAA